MINIIRNIFVDKKYSVNNAFEDINQQGFIASMNKVNKREYYFVINIDVNKIKNNDIDNIIDEIIERYWNIEILKKYDVSSDFKKNTSLLILIQVDKLGDEYDINNKIYDIEESTYFFKRYTLIYTLHQVELLGEISTNSYEDILCDKKLFEKYKESKNDEDNLNNSFSDEALIYDIIAKVFIKLPFLIYPFTKNQQLLILKEQIEKQLNEKQLAISQIIDDADIEKSDLYDLFREVIDNPTDEEIEKRYNEILKEMVNE